MTTFLKKYKIQLIIALATAIGIYMYPVIRGGGSASAASEFRTAFGQLALISYVLYLGLYFVFSMLVRRYQMHQSFVYIAHAVAFAMGYYILVAAYLSIAAGGIPSII